MDHHFGHEHPRRKRRSCDNSVPDCDVPGCDGCDLPGCDGCDGCDVCDCNLSVFRLFRLSSLLLVVARLTPDHRHAADHRQTADHRRAGVRGRTADHRQTAGRSHAADPYRAGDRSLAGSREDAGRPHPAGGARGPADTRLPVVDRAGLAAIAAYQHWISPRTAPRCRFTPTCSAYGSQAVARHGMRDGLRLTAARLRRCGRSVPAGSIDPVP